MKLKFSLFFFKKILKTVLFLIFIQFSNVFFFELDLLIYFKEYFNFFCSNANLHFNKIMYCVDDENIKEPVKENVKEAVKEPYYRFEYVDENPLNQGTDNPQYHPCQACGNNPTAHNYMKRIPYDPRYDVHSEHFVPIRTHEDMVEMFKFCGVIPQDFGYDTPDFFAKKIFQDLHGFDPTIHPNPLDLSLPWGKDYKPYDMREVRDYSYREIFDALVLTSLIMIIISWFV